VKFRTLAIITALVSALLFFAWLFAPQMMLSNWGVVPSDSALLVGRRCSVLFGAFAVMFYRVKDLGPSAARRAIVSGAIFTYTFAAMLGVYELWAGHAGSGILGAVVLEVFFVLAFVWVSHGERRGAFLSSN
jgi:membrane protein CcdC involved in cytochrome C biogenesis